MTSVTTYPPHGTHVYINNRFRDPLSQPAYKFRCPQFAQPNNDQGSYLCVVKQVMTENFIYTVCENQNDILCWVNDGQEYIYTVPQENYTVDSLITLLNTVLSPYNVVLSYDSDLRKISVTKTGVNVFKLISPDQIQETQAVSFTKRGNRFLRMLGLYEEASQGNVLSGVFTANNPVHLNRTSALFINIYNQINVMHSDIRNPQSIVAVPLDVGYGEKVIYTPATPPTFQIQPNALESLGIYVTDEWGEEVQVPDNTGLLIHLVLYQISTS